MDHKWNGATAIFINKLTTTKNNANLTKNISSGVKEYSLEKKYDKNVISEK